MIPLLLAACGGDPYPPPAYGTWHLSVESSEVDTCGVAARLGASLVWDLYDSEDDPGDLFVLAPTDRSVQLVCGAGPGGFACGVSPFELFEAPPDPAVAIWIDGERSGADLRLYVEAAEARATDACETRATLRFSQDPAPAGDGAAAASCVELASAAPEEGGPSSVTMVNGTGEDLVLTYALAAGEWSAAFAVVPASAEVPITTTIGHLLKAQDADGACVEINRVVEGQSRILLGDGQ